VGHEGGHEGVGVSQALMRFVVVNLLRGWEHISTTNINLFCSAMQAITATAHPANA
jgi:hypothetical protein